MKHSLTIPVVAPPAPAETDGFEDLRAMGELTTLQGLRDALSYLDEVTVPPTATVRSQPGVFGLQRALIVTWDDGK